MKNRLILLIGALALVFTYSCNSPAAQEKEPVVDSTEEVVIEEEPTQVEGNTYFKWTGKDDKLGDVFENLQISFEGDKIVGDGNGGTTDLDENWIFSFEGEKKSEDTYSVTVIAAPPDAPTQVETKEEWVITEGKIIRKEADISKDFLKIDKSQYRG